MDSTLLDQAIHFAVDAHAGMERRGKGFPYIVHPLEAVAIVATMTSDQTLLSAAALHDVVEDTPVTIEQIHDTFGADVAALVAAESHNPGEGWRESRQHTLERLRTATRNCKIVALGDKLSNMRAIARDYRDLGPQLWQRFNAPNGADDYAWYYRSLVVALQELHDTEAHQELARLVQEVFPLD